MTAIAPLSLSTGYILAGLLSCNPQAAPAVTLNFLNNPVRINNSRSSQELEALRAKSVSPSYGGEFPIVDGITDGSFQVNYDMNFTSATRPLLDNVCIWINNVNITVTYSATVYIASKYKPGSCRYDLTKTHEMKHVNTDLLTVNEYLPYIKQVTELTLTQGHSMDSIDAGGIENFKNGISKQLSDVLEQATANMQRTRTMRQTLVDSHEEYRRLSEACPQERPR